jgi:hypothetical protein
MGAQADFEPRKVLAHARDVAFELAAFEHQTRRFQLTEISHAHTVRR